MDCVEEGGQNDRNLTQFWTPDPATKESDVTFEIAGDPAGPVFRTMVQIGGINQTIWFGCNTLEFELNPDVNLNGILGVSFRSQSSEALNDTIGPSRNPNEDPPLNGLAAPYLLNSTTGQQTASSAVTKRSLSSFIVPRDTNGTYNPNTKLITCGNSDGSAASNNNTSTNNTATNSTAKSNDTTQPIEIYEVPVPGAAMEIVPPIGSSANGMNFMEAAKLNWKVDITKKDWGFGSEVGSDAGSFTFYQATDNSSSITYIPVANPPPFWVVEVQSVTIGKDMVMNGPWKALLGKPCSLQNMISITDTRTSIDTTILGTFLPNDIYDSYTDSATVMWPDLVCKEDGTLPYLATPYSVDCNATDIPSITFNFLADFETNHTYSVEMPGSLFKGGVATPLGDSGRPLHTNTTDSNGNTQNPNSEFCEVHLYQMDSEMNMDANGNPINGSVLFDMRLGLPFMSLQPLFFEQFELNGVKGDGKSPIKGRVGFAQK